MPRRRIRSRVLLLTALSVLLAACGNTKVDDPELKPIQEMLDAQLPPGSPHTMVNQFVTTRGYSIEPSGKADAMAVIIRHIDQQKLKPVTARVTFHFDASDKLVKTDIVRTFNQNAIPPPSEPDAQPQPQSQPEPASPPPQ